jgi:hypothetical protein
MIEAKHVVKFGAADSTIGAHRWAHTLSPSVLGANESGWVVEGEVSEDYYKWVNDFQAIHPELGIVCGNFESEVSATSEEAYADFVANHPPSEWDYWDI